VHEAYCQCKISRRSRSHRLALMFVMTLRTANVGGRQHATDIRSGARTEAEGYVPRVRERSPGYYRAKGARGTEHLLRRSTIAPRTCSASWRQSLARPPPEIPNISSIASRSASGRFHPIIKMHGKGSGSSDLVRAQLAAFADFLGFRIALCRPKLRLNAAAAQAVEFALHESSTMPGGPVRSR
jgi:hypothetical protein